MVESTGISESAAIGQTLARLVPELADRGMLTRLRRVAEGGGPEVLAPAFHKYFISCPPREPGSSFDRMRQNVTIAPLRDRQAIVGVVVTIEDVTARLENERRLAADLDSRAEATRLRAAETLAAARESPMLLAGALGDESWRVRKVAAEGLAAGGGGQEIVRRLVGAIRDSHRNPALLNAALTALSRTRDDALAALSELLEDPDADVRTYAALALGLTEDSRAVPALVRRLDDADTNVRFHAIEALGRIRDADAAEPLVAIAESRDFFLSFAALDALAAIGEPSVVPRIIALLDDEALLSAVASCLGALGAEDAAPALARLIERPGAPVAELACALANIHDRIESQIGEGALIADLAQSVMSEQSAQRIAETLPTANTDEIRGMLRVLSWLRHDGVGTMLAGFLGREDVRYVAADCLARRGVSAAIDVVRATDGASPEVRQIAAEILGRVGSADSTPTLISWLDEEPDLIIAAAGALGAIGDRRAFEPLLALLDHQDAAVRQAAVSALNSIGHPRMEEAIAGRLTDESPRVRESAARIAGYFGYESCLRRLVDLCDDEEETVRRAAAEHLASYDRSQAWSKIFETLRTDRSATVRAAAARALGQAQSQQAVTALTTAARDSNLWVRYFALRALGQAGTAHADALACLAECATRDDAPPVRIAAIDSLAAIGSPTMGIVVRPIVLDRNVEVATAAVAALASFDAEESERELRFAIDGSEPRLVREALDTIGHLRAGYMVPFLSSLIRENPDDEVRRQAVRTLGQIGNSAAVEALLALSGDRRLRDSVIAAIASLDAEGTADLRVYLSTSDEPRRRTIVNAVGRNKTEAAAGVLAAALEDESPRVRLAAARALGRIDLRDARAQLTIVARSDADFTVRRAAEDALTR